MNWPLYLYWCDMAVGHLVYLHSINTSLKWSSQCDLKGSDGGVESEMKAFLKRRHYHGNK